VENKHKYHCKAVKKFLLNMRRKFWSIWIFVLVLSLLSFNLSANAQDWPNLGRYHEDNEHLKTGGTKIDAVFLGNSITDFWIGESPEFFEKNHFVDRGISGQTSPQMLLRFRADVIDLHPRVVVILAGTNDIAGNTGPMTLKMIEDNIVSLTELAKINNITVILCSVLPTSDFKNRPPEKIDSLNNWQKQYSIGNRISYLDYYSSFVDANKGMKPEYTGDGLHPNKRGYELMEGLVGPLINELLTGKRK
jgi:lysophospholipase L1-like esterase